MWELIFPEKYFLDVDQTIKKAVPNEFYYYLPFLSKVSEETLEAIKLSLPQNKIDFEAKLYEDGEVTYIGRLSRLEFDKNRGIVIVHLQNNEKVLLYPKYLNKKPSEIINDLKNAELVYFELRLRRGKKYKKTNIVVSYYDVLAKEKADINEILAYKKSIQLKNWEMLLASVGIIPTINGKELLGLYLPRIISLFRVQTPAQNSYNHVLQFTLPGKGKTMFYSKLALVWNMEVLTRLPSRARLIADARGGKLGLVFLRRIIVIDAFDKELGNRQNLEEFFTSIETGMANALWSLEKSSTIELRQEYKETGFVFLGNIEGTLDFMNMVQNQLRTTRDYLRNLLEKEGINKGLINAFLDRLAIVDINDSDIDLKDHVQDKIMKASYLKALLSYIEEEANKVQIDTNKIQLKGRYYTYAIRVAKILRALEIEPAEELANALVKGEWNWYDLIKSETNKISSEEFGK